MYEAFAQGLIDVQDEVRAAFGWTLVPDRESAEQMVDLVNAHGERTSLWAPNGREESLRVLSRRLSEGDEIVILGAAVTAAEVLNLPKTPHLIIAADGSPLVPWTNVRRRLACVVSDFDGGAHLHSRCPGWAHSDRCPRSWRSDSTFEHWRTSSGTVGRPPLLRLLRCFSSTSDA